MAMEPKSADHKTPKGWSYIQKISLGGWIENTLWFHPKKHVFSHFTHTFMIIWQHMMARDTTIGDVEYINIKETYKRSGKHHQQGSHIAIWSINK